tara:strand:+ start:315 stop:1289 length:975 start_codon:yes stop_codon:yes gene_type:complete
MIFREIPGKLFLMGEYAVMKPGHPALVLAVDRTLRVGISEYEGIRIEIPSWKIELDEAVLEADNSENPRLQFLCRLLEAMFLRLGERRSFHLVIEPHSRDLAGRDLGLGTSSALSVALAQALLPKEKRDSTRILALALGAHQDVQGGKGSGADVTTSWAGRSICYERVGQGVPKFSLLAQPRDFHFAAAFSGVSQRTASAVKAFEQLEATRPLPVGRFCQRSARLVTQALDSWGSRGLSTLRHVESAGKLMAELAKLLNADAPVPEFLLAAAQIGGGVIKPSGSLGGDCYCLLANSGDNLERVKKMAQGAGYEILDLKPVFGGR